MFGPRNVNGFRCKSLEIERVSYITNNARASKPAHFAAVGAGPFDQDVSCGCAPPQYFSSPTLSFVVSATPCTRCVEKFSTSRSTKAGVPCDRFAFTFTNDTSRACSTTNG